MSSENTENPEENKKPEDTEERYIICPVCNETNPASAKFCEHCWGAALNQENALTKDELSEVHGKRTKYLQRKKRIRKGILAGLGVIILVLAVLWVVNYTDIVSKPVAELNSNPLPGDWSTFRYNILHTGSYGPDTVIPEGKLKWEFTTGAVVHSSPTVIDGKVFIGSQDNYLYALDQETGAVDWKFQTGSRVDSSPAVVDGTVYFGSNDSYLYAVNADNGETEWKFDTKYPVRSSPAVAGDTLYFGSDDYLLYAVNKDTGKLQWRFDTDGMASSSPVIDDGLLAYGSSGAFSYILNAHNGGLRLMFQPGNTVFASATFDDGVVYFISTNGIVWAVDEMARTWFREHEITPYWRQAWAMMPWLPEPPTQSGLLWSVPTKSPNPTTPVVQDGVMYFGAGNNLIALDLETHEILWKYETGDSVRSSPALAGNVLYAGSNDGNLYAINAATGEMIWKYNTGAPVTSSPAVVDGVVFVGSDSGKVYAIE